MAVHPVCWLAVSVSGVGLAIMGIMLRIVWQRLGECDTARLEQARSLNVVETKLLMLETWKVAHDG